MGGGPRKKTGCKTVQLLQLKTPASSLSKGKAAAGKGFTWIQESCIRGHRALHFTPMNTTEVRGSPQTLLQLLVMAHRNDFPVHSHRVLPGAVLTCITATEHGPASGGYSQPEPAACSTARTCVRTARGSAPSPTHLQTISMRSFPR